MKCSSCGVNVQNQKNWVEFGCPDCGKTKVIRCERCRKLSNAYTCGSCRFEGP